MYPIDRPVSILHLEDDPVDADLIALRISGGLSATIHLVSTEEHYRAALDQGGFDVILSDYRLTPYDGDQALLLARQVCPRIPFIMVTGELGEDRAIETLKRGAWDYVLKDNLKRLVPAIERALHEAESAFMHACAEQALRESEEQFRNLILTLPAALYTTDKEGRITLYNDAAAEMWGRRPEVGVDLWCGSWKIFNQDGTLLPNDECPMARTLRSGERTWGHEIVVERPDGSRAHVLPYPSPLRDASGEMVGAVNMLVDVTDRRQAEENVRSSEERFRHLCESMPHIAWIQKGAGALEYLNSQWFAYTGLTPDQSYGNSPERRDVVHADDFSSANATYRESFANGTECTVEYRLRRKDGTFRWHLARIVPIVDANGAITEWFGTATDIHELKEVQEKTRTMNEELERRVTERTSQLEDTNTSLDAFAHSVAHDLRSPLRSITGIAQILMEEQAEALSDDARRMLERIVESALNANGLVDALLGFARAGKASIRKQPVDMRALVAELAGRMDDEERARLDVRVYDLPGAYADPVLIRQVLENLFSNAIKYTQRTPNAVAEIGSFRSNGDDVYFVKDNGVGFDSNDAGTLFTAFRRLHSEPEFEGYGVGLANVKRIVERHGGRVWAEGRPDKGATFFFSLPRAGADVSSMEARPLPEIDLTV